MSRIQSRTLCLLVQRDAVHDASSQQQHGRDLAGITTSIAFDDEVTIVFVHQPCFRLQLT